MFQIPESDWQVLREIRQDLLNNACEDVFVKMQEIADARDGRQLEALQELKALLTREERRLVVLFDEIKPSTALVRIINLCKMGLLGEEQFSRLSEPTRERIITLLDDRR